MLQRFRIRGFKSLTNVDISLPSLTLLVGPNSAGKSNFLDALQALSRVATERTLSDAMSDPIRGYPVEAFAFPPNGLPELLSGGEATFSLEADVRPAQPPNAKKRWKDIRYRVKVRIVPASGTLSVQDEYLTELRTDGAPVGLPRIEAEGDQLLVRQVGQAGRPRNEQIGLNYALVSDPRRAGQKYHPFERLRSELSSWRVYYLDPRVSMRKPTPPSDVTDIGTLGENIAPFLYRLRAEEEKHFAQVVRALKSLIPAIEGLEVDLDKTRGTLDIQVRQDGVNYSSRIISEGTLRILALCAIAANPWQTSLVAFEEPENGVHPRRLELIADLLWSLASTPGRQVVVTTHSPRFCDAVLDSRCAEEGQLAIILARRRGSATELVPFESSGPLFDNREITEALKQQGENGSFEGLVVRGLLDE